MRQFETWPGGLWPPQVPPGQPVYSAQLKQRMELPSQAEVARQVFLEKTMS